jgi:hypothetical protein
LFLSTLVVYFTLPRLALSSILFFACATSLRR